MEKKELTRDDIFVALVGELHTAVTAAENAIEKLNLRPNEDAEKTKQDFIEAFTSLYDMSKEQATLTANVFVDINNLLALHMICELQKEKK